jgi:hypothetical protein
MDVIHTGATWHRQVTITGDDGSPVDPTSMVATVCPATPATVTTTSPGVYVATLTDTDTAALTPGVTSWELWGTVGSDRLQLVSERLLIADACGS